MKVAVITSSDSGYAGVREDLSGPRVQEIARSFGAEIVYTNLLPDTQEVL